MYVAYDFATTALTLSVTVPEELFAERLFNLRFYGHVEKMKGKNLLKNMMEWSQVGKCTGRLATK